MKLALLVVLNGLYLPFDVSSILDSVGIERGEAVRMECRAPYKICEEVLFEMYKQGFVVSKNTGFHSFIVGPVKEDMKGSFLFIEVDGKKDSFEISMKRGDKVGTMENTSVKGFLSTLVFLVMGYLLFFVIR